MKSFKKFEKYKKNAGREPNGESGTFLRLAQMAAGLLMMLAVKNQNTNFSSLFLFPNEEAAAANSVGSCDAHVSRCARRRSAHWNVALVAGRIRRISAGTSA